MDIRKAGSAMPAAWNSVVKTKIMPITGAVIMRQRSIRAPETTMTSSCMKMRMMGGAKIQAAAVKTSAMRSCTSRSKCRNCFRRSRLSAP